MAERAASVPYSGALPAPSGAIEQNGSGAQPYHLDATPASFGGAIAQGMGKVGEGIEQDMKVVNGMITETSANQAEIESARQSAPLIAKYRSMEGMAAYAAAPQFEKDLSTVNAQIRSGLTPAAQRMFDQTTVRRYSYLVQDYQTYAATQLKKATLDSNNAVASNAVSEAGELNVASSDTRFGEKLGDIKHSVNSMMDLQGWGGYATTDPKTGQTTFADSPEGKRAQTVYQAELDKRVGMAWEKRLTALADDNVANAYKVFQDNRDKIPGEAQVKMANYFTPKVRDFDARGIADDVYGQYHQEYQNSLQRTGTGTTSDIASAIHQQESGGKPHDFQIQEGTFARYAKPGEKFDNPEDHDKVYGRIMDDLKSKYPNDPARQAVAYFSGEGNVAPAGSATPWKHDTHDKNGKQVSEYVSDIGGRLGGQTQEGTGQYASFPDYLRANGTKIMEEARARAVASPHGDDPAFVDNAVQKTMQRTESQIAWQEKQYKADTDMVSKAIGGSLSKGQLPRTIEELRAVSPEVAKSYDAAVSRDPKNVEGYEKRLTANARGDTVNNSPNYYGNLTRALQGEDTPNHLANEQQVHSLLGRADTTGITLKDYNDLNKAVSFPDQWKRFMLSKMKEIENAGGNVDGKGQQRALNYYSSANELMEQRKANNVSLQDMVNPENSNYINLSGNFMKPRAEQIQTLAQNTRQVPTIKSPDDPAFAALPKGAHFMADGVERVKH